MDRCPKCGAEPNGDNNPYADWRCGSFTLNDGRIYQTQTCRIRELERAIRTHGFVVADFVQAANEQENAE